MTTPVLQDRRRFLATSLMALLAPGCAHTETPAPLPPAPPVPSQPRGAFSGPAPVIAAPSAILVDALSGAILFEKNPDQPRQVASTQKLITALVLAEGGGLENRVTVEAGDLNVEPTKLGIKPGSRYGRGYLLQAMLVKSCNDVARCLARDFAGSEAAFGRVMTQRAARLGCKNSHFTNASGLPVPGQYSTARDMAVIARAVHSNPLLRQIVRIRYLPFRYADGKQTLLESTNKLMRECDYVTGMKTGYTNGAGKCLISSAEYNGREVISIVLGSSTKYVWDESRRLLDYGLTK